MDRKKVLIVEDEPDIAELVRITLEKCGYDTITAAGGREAINSARDQKPDLILMDISLKDKMDGIEAAKQIRFSFDVPVIYLTAYADDERLARVKETQPYGYILKPFEDRELKTAVEISLCKAESDRKLKVLTEELRGSRANFQDIIGKITDGIVIVDGNKIVRFVNPAAEVMFGFRIEQVIGKEFSFSIAVGQATKVKIVHDGGKFGIGEMHAVETRWESKPAYLISVRDITERRKTEEKAEKEPLNPVVEKSKCQKSLF
jgi:CheY-like chemotaxis protein